ncbi:Hypothetical predicted protein, partial [Pelobates cultripes]
SLMVLAPLCTGSFRTYGKISASEEYQILLRGVLGILFLQVDICSAVDSLSTTPRK